MRRTAATLLLVLLALLGVSAATAQETRSSRPVVVASKPFGESFILAEMFAQLLEARGIPVVREPGLGSTEILVGALRSGGVDVYPEYTGTGLLAILHDTLARETLAVPVWHEFSAVSKPVDWSIAKLSIRSGSVAAKRNRWLGSSSIRRRDAIAGAGRRERTDRGERART